MPATTLLTIAIPTWRRAAFLAQTLKQIREELCRCADSHRVEILVSDNCSPDETPKVVENEINAGLAINYVRNEENIGSDANIAQCFNLASGRYVLILGDDDVLVDGVLNRLIQLLSGSEFGVVCLRPYGFDLDFLAEHPGFRGKERCYTDPGAFLARIAHLMTLISACVINKERLPGVDARRFCGANLVQVHLVVAAAMAAKVNLLIERYSVACKRNNSGGYDFSEVFVTALGRILDGFKAQGLSRKAIEAIEARLLIGYYPFYLLLQRINRSGDLAATYQRFERRFAGRRLFHWWVAPIIVLPRPLALFWGGVATLIGRIANGDLERGVRFVLNKLARI